MFVLFFVFNLTIIFIFTNYSNAQTDEFNFNIYHEMDFIEYANSLNSEENITGIDLQFPSSNWNMTDLNLNFTNLEYLRGIKIVEDNIIAGNIESIERRFITAMSVQIKLEDITTIYGVEIYGYAKNPNPSLDLVFLQIQGYDNNLNTPNGTIFHEEELNMSTEIKWYKQIFSSPLKLSPGNYSLVINVDNTENPQTTYNWYYNDELDAPQLYTCEYTGSWNVLAKGKPLLYKIDQKILEDIYPNDINMSLTLANSTYKVNNGKTIGTGFFNISGVNIAPSESNILNIEISKNKSYNLIFNLNYSLILFKIVNSNTILKITNYLNIVNWTLNPDIIRCSCNNSVVFNYPKSWYNFRIFRDNIDVTSNITIIPGENKILISNSIITEDSKWIIKANSLYVDFQLEVPETNFEAKQNLRFSVSPPSQDGNLTFILYDSLEFKEFEEKRTLPTENLTFSYSIPENPQEGIHTAYIIWNNATDAGIQVQEFQITVPFTLDPMLIIIIAVGSIVGIAASIGTYQVYKREKIRKEKHRQKIYNKYMDILNLQYILIIDKKSGLEVYQQKFAGKEMDATLVSGFLEAMRSFGIELTNTQELAQTIKLDFQKSKILMSEYMNFRLILIMSENPSDNFLESIKDLSLSIEKYYGESIRQFHGGKIKQFEGIRDLIDEHLNTTLTYPLKINEKIDIKKLSSEEKLLVKRAKNIITEQNEYFFITYLIGKRGKFSVAEAETILKLIKKKVLVPYQNKIL